MADLEQGASQQSSDPPLDFSTLAAARRSAAYCLSASGKELLSTLIPAVFCGLVTKTVVGADWKTAISETVLQASIARLSVVSTRLTKRIFDPDHKHLDRHKYAAFWTQNTGLILAAMQGVICRLGVPVDTERVHYSQSVATELIAHGFHTLWLLERDVPSAAPSESSAADRSLTE